MTVRSRRLLVLAAATSLAPTLIGAGLQEPPVFRTTSDLVRVPVVVFSSDSGPVLDLTVDDFKIVEQGQERPISVFIGPDSGPLEVALVIDSSGSMSRWPTREATTALLDSLDPGSCVLVLPFNESVHTGVWGHPGDESVRATVAGLRLDGEEAIYDALLVAFDLMRARAATQDSAGVPSKAGDDSLSFGDLMRFRIPGRTPGAGVVQTEGNCTIWRHPFSTADPARGVRRAIAIVTDGADHESHATLEDVLLSAWGSSLPVFAFAVTMRSGGGSLEVRGMPARLGHLRALEQVAEYTGGSVIRVTMDLSDRFDRSGKAFLDGFQRLGAALRSHYVLGYVPEKGDDPFALVDRRSIEVSVRHRGFDVLAPSDLVLGRGASEGAAFDLALRGFHQLATGRAESALATFDTAAALGPALGLVHYGRGTALSLLKRYAAALAALRTAATLAPWIPDLNARIAELLVNVGELDAAWEQVLRAYQGGSQVVELIDRLQQLAPRDVDLTRLPIGRRISVRATGRTSATGALATLPLLAALQTAIEESVHLSLSHARVPKRGQPVLLLDVAKVKKHGRRISLSGWLALENEAGKKLLNQAGKKLLEQRFSLQDASAAAEIGPIAAAVVAKIEQGLLGEQ